VISIRSYRADEQLNKPSAVQRLLYTGPLATLFPFIRLTSTYLPTPPPFPPPLIAPNNLPNITRKQLIDSLSKLTSSAQQSLYTEGLVFELLVEYIGRRWRSGEKDIVDNVARKLTEVEFEVCPCQATCRGGSADNEDTGSGRPTYYAIDGSACATKSSISPRLPIEQPTCPPTQCSVQRLATKLGPNPNRPRTIDQSIHCSTPRCRI
jgi:hypothetical protein